jgi:phosphatidylglycerophosphate synthase
MLEVTRPALGVLALLLLGLVAVGMATARTPQRPIPGPDEHRRRWTALHAGIEPGRSRWVSGWLALMYVLARPLARRGVLPDVVTAAGLWWALATLVVADAGGRWPLLAAWLLLAGGIADGLDGALAVLTDRVSAWGGVLDSVVDRLSDVVLVGAVATLAGDRPLVWLAAAAAVTGLFTLEYLRARAAQMGAELAVVTVGERATRLVLVGVTLWCAGLFPARAVLIGLLGLWSVAAVGVVGSVQLGVHARRTLR